MQYVLPLICVMITLTATAQLQTPQWELPIYLTNGDGQKDTIFLGVDTLATLGFDTLFEDSVPGPLTGKFSAYLVGGGVNLWVKRNVVPPDSNGFPLHILAVNIASGIEMMLDPQILGDTLHGVKNLVWDEQLQKNVPDVYKGSQLWITFNTMGEDYVSNCGFHGGNTVAFVGGTPELPGMKDYPVCYLGNYLQLNSVNTDITSFFDVELKPMNILGSPLIGVQELGDLNIQFYPNPITELLTINNQETLPFTVVIYDNLSREVKRLQISPFEILQTDLSDLPSGMYLVELRNTKSSAFKKVLKG